MPAADLVDGRGQVFASADHTIALDAAAGQRLRVLAFSVGGRTLVGVVLVPRAGNWQPAWAKAAGVLRAVEPS